jgi:hypothetical protein
MSNFNERTALNYRLRQDALTVEGRRRMAHQRIAYRHRRAARRSMVRTVAIDAALIGSILTACVVLLVYAVG